MSKTIKTPLAEFHKAKTSTIADIPASLALETSEQWKTIRDARLIQDLTRFRIDMKNEAGVDLAAIKTNLALALADIAKYLGITDPGDLLRILGEAAYLHAYEDPIPYQLPTPPHHKIRLLLAKLRDTWRGPV